MKSYKALQRERHTFVSSLLFRHDSVITIILTKRDPLCPLRNRTDKTFNINPYPTAFPYGNGMVLHFYQQQESSTTKTVHKVINKGLKAYV